MSAVHVVHWLVGYPGTPEGHQRQGLALCDLPGLPKDWPYGHAWVSAAHNRNDGLPRAETTVTCDGCKARLGGTDVTNQDDIDNDVTKEDEIESELFKLSTQMRDAVHVIRAHSEVPFDVAGLERTFLLRMVAELKVAVRELQELKP